ncbi:hypothetical protein [Leadbetterella byssophila]|jgi:hypothetical protein|uniref:hypothetical protein n=1 Tax=Leadbetterella byssophila TaxID=316068 RepID=UPI0005A10C8F|nr:hypothetical protein [Leadbetterella byssophila]
MRVITLSLVTVFFCLFVSGCKSSEVAEIDNSNSISLMAPSGDYIAKSHEDLVKRIADIYKDPSSKIKLVQIDYLNLSEGFAATVSFEHSEHGKSKVVLMPANKVQDAEEMNSEKLRVSVEEEPPVTVYCSCGNNTFPSSQCEVTVTVNTNGSVSTTCKVTGCSWGCVAHVEM